MCSECLMTPCHPRCPNASPPEALYECPYCKDDIVAGEKMVYVDGDYYHLECLEDMSFDELLKVMDLCVEEASA